VNDYCTRFPVPVVNILLTTTASNVLYTLLKLVPSKRSLVLILSRKLLPVMLAKMVGKSFVRVFLSSLKLNGAAKKD